MIAGGRLAFSAAWVGVVVSEILSTQESLGGLITAFSDAYRTTDMLMPITPSSTPTANSTGRTSYGRVSTPA
jgi:ABC-type nitrate/sulfonate/bicarbonate transport system permease component